MLQADKARKKRVEDEALAVDKRKELEGLKTQVRPPPQPLAPPRLLEIIP